MRFANIKLFFFLILISGFLNSDNFQITFDMYFKGHYLGDALAFVSPEGELISVNTKLVLKKLPKLLLEAGVHDHPLLNKYYQAHFLKPKAWLNALGLIIKPSLKDFHINIYLPAKYKPIKDISIQKSKLEKAATIKPAKLYAWLTLTGRLGSADDKLVYNGTWRGKYSLLNWHFFANGNYGNYNSDENDEHYLEKWRFERNIWKNKKTVLQLGWVEPSLIINGQHISNNIIGMSFSNVYNHYLQTGLIKELPGGIIELYEKSTIEIYRDDILVKTLSLDIGRYKLRNLFFSDGVHFVTLRIVSTSGRITTKRVRIESFADHPPAGKFEYSFYAGVDMSKNEEEERKETSNFQAGGAIYRGFKHGMAAGMHASVSEVNGYRMGGYLN